MSLSTVLNTLVDNIESDYGLLAFAKGLYETQLVRPSVFLGGDARTEIKEEIIHANLDGDKVGKSLRISRVDLSEIYHNKLKRVNKIFYLSLITIGITLALIVIGLIIIFIERSQVKMGIITSASSMLPGIISGTAFWLQRIESNGLMPVEQDIMKISKLESFLKMIQYISDVEQKKKAIEDIIRQMSPWGSRKDSSIKILILSANPKDTNRLRLDEEVREIEECLKRSNQREQFEIKARLAIRFQDLRRALLDYEPQVLHFSGHGGEEGLMVEGELGIAVPISPKTLSGLFELCSDHVECIILNACHSEPQAAAINKHINYVIGMQKEIKDKAAIEFAVGFYDALGAGKPVEEAFKFGCNAILNAFPDQHEYLIPVLKKKEQSS